MLLCDFCLVCKCHFCLYFWLIFMLNLLLASSVEVILRAEAVEQAQAGDRCDFTGTLVVVPDVSKLSVPGNQTTSYLSFS